MYISILSPKKSTRIHTDLQKSIQIQADTSGFLQILKKGEERMNIFSDLVKHTNNDELLMLGYLMENEADAKFKAIRRGAIKEGLSLTQALIRRNLLTLSAKQFIEIIHQSKEQSVYITEYGQRALGESLKEEVE